MYLNSGSLYYLPRILLNITCIIIQVNLLCWISSILYSQNHANIHWFLGKVEQSNACLEISRFFNSKITLVRAPRSSYFMLVDNLSRKLVLCLISGLKLHNVEFSKNNDNYWTILKGFLVVVSRCEIQTYFTFRFTLKVNAIKVVTTNILTITNNSVSS